jgi:hypothetical protein
MAMGQVTSPLAMMLDSEFFMSTKILLKSRPQPLERRKLIKILPSISMGEALKINCIFLLSTVVTVIWNLVHEVNNLHTNNLNEIHTSPTAFNLQEYPFPSRTPFKVVRVSSKLVLTKNLVILFTSFWYVVCKMR